MENPSDLPSMAGGVSGICKYLVIYVVYNTVLFP